MLKEFRTLIPYVKKRILQYLAGLFFLLVTNGGQLYLPQLLRRAIDTIVSGTFTMRSIIPIVLWMVGIAVIVAAGRYLWRYFLGGASRHIEAELRERLFVHLQALSSTFYGKMKTGDIMARMTNDMNAVRQASGFALVSFVDGFFMTIAILAIMLSRSPRLTLLSISPLPIITIGVISFGRVIGEQFRRVQEGFSELSDMAQESLTGIRVLKTFVRESTFGKRFLEKNMDYSNRNMVLVRTWGVLFPAVGFLAGITTLILILVGGRAVIEGSLSPGEFTAFLAYLQMLIWPMLGAGFTINMIQRAGASLSRINRILDEQPDIRSPEQQPPEPEPATGPAGQPVRGEIRIRNLSYAYPGTERAALRYIDLEVPAGSILGILGKTGSGKSTLVQLLPRILDPPPGTVFLDGRDVRLYPLAELRNSVSMVPQDTFLFSTSIRENIAFGSRNGDERLIRQVAGISTIERDYSTFPAGAQTIVGERGISLSGGQKQRVAISRALASDACLYIFDDSLSSVDTETEDAIIRGLLPFLRGKTLILISHRISALKTADQVIVLENGRIVQQGTHEQLLEQKGFYADIYRLQQLEEALRKKK
ncbi:MAG: ABC transporter ATP-binding protein [Spirochaetales bacterium]|nr:ABC transporter ATP-binding protein [Spirochaetales bacterium]